MRSLARLLLVAATVSLQPACAKSSSSSGAATATPKPAGPAAPAAPAAPATPAGTVAVAVGTQTIASTTVTGTSTLIVSGQNAQAYEVGTVALSVESVGNGGAGLTGAGSGFALTQNFPVLGKENSMTPVHYLLPIQTIVMSNSQNSNALVMTSTATGSATATLTGSGTGTGTGTTLALAGTGTGTGSGCDVNTGAGCNSGSGSGSGSCNSSTGAGCNGSVNPNKVTLYNCAAGTESGCFVDLQDNAAMAALFKPVSVPVGTFDTIGYGVVCTSSIGPNGGFHVGIDGAVSIGPSGTTYVSTANGGVLAIGTTGSAQEGTATAEIDGCGGETTFKLPEPITVAAGQSVSVSLFLSAKNIAWAGTDGAYNPGGCVNSGNNYICTNLPAFVPVAGNFSPNFELYTITVYSDANRSQNPTGGQIEILSDNQSNALGAFFARLSTPTVISNNALWDAGVEVFTKNGDGTYDIASGTDPNQTGPRCEFKNFGRLGVGATGIGTVSNNGNITLYYQAVRTQ